MFAVSSWRPLGEREYLFLLFIATLCATTTCPPAASQHQIAKVLSETNTTSQHLQDGGDLTLAESTSNASNNNSIAESFKQKAINNHSNDGGRNDRQHDSSLNHPNFSPVTRPEGPFYSLDDYLPEIIDHPHLKLPRQPSTAVSNQNQYSQFRPEQPQNIYHDNQPPSRHFAQDYAPQKHDFQQTSIPVRMPPNQPEEPVVLQQYVAPIEVRQVKPSNVKFMKQLRHQPIPNNNMQQQQQQHQDNHHNPIHPNKDQASSQQTEPDDEEEESPIEKPIKVSPAQAKLVEQTVAKLKVVPVFRPSILKRPKVVNLTSMLKPGQVIMAEKTTSGGRTDTALGPVRADEIVTMLKRLQSFAVKESEKPKADDEDTYSYEKDDDEEERQKSDSKHRSERVLPTAHLFGSVGSINENKVNSGTSNAIVKEVRNSEDDDDDDDDDDERKVDEQRRQAEMSEDMLFLKSLADLGSKLKDKRQQELELRPLDAEYYGDRNRDGSKYDARASNEYKQLTEAPDAIPIDVLVDHLMSSSRLASFGVQHTGIRDPNIAEGADAGGGSGAAAADEDDDDEEEEEEEDDGALPSEDEAESVISETKIKPNKTSVSFNAVMNRSDTWIPLDSIAVKSKQLLKDGGDFKDASAIEEQKLRLRRKAKGKKKKKKKKKKRKKRGNGELVLVIGDKMLSRRDLIRLIKVLNKMASQKEPSKEREASRRLLRFLVKLALEEYKKNELSNGSSDKNDPIREVLRSVLMGPVYGKDWSSEKDGSIQLKPMSVKRIKQKKEEGEAKGAESSDLIEDEKIDTKPKQPKEPGKKKKLDQLSDDLEMYFESDFFEDLADKGNATKSKKTAASKPKKLRRASRAGYSLPVPIYGKQQIEAADEDDVDLDHVRIHKPSQHQAKKLSSAHRSVMEKQPPAEEEEAKVEVQEKSQPPPREEDTPEEEDPEEQQVMKERKPPTNRRMAPEQPEQVIAPKEIATDESEEPSDSNDDDDEDSEPDLPDKSAADEIEEEMNQNENKTKKKTGRRRRRKRRMKGLRGQNEPSIHPDDRDEIPAPILAGRTERVVVRNPKKQEKKQSKTSDSSNQKSPKVIKKKKKSTESKKTKPKTKEKEKDKSKSGKKKSATPPTGKATGAEQKDGKKEVVKKDRNRRERPRGGEKKSKGEKDPDEEFRDDMIDRQPVELEEPKEPPRDPDYYNEGTSYSKVCEDDGPCKVSVQSSSPGLSKAIKARDKPTIAKWVSKN